ncbi:MULTISPECIES: hypothetical protein [unclassified Pseudomonas]|uniref:hypothetical protein n=1 Tax=unclassified Pseudomonas TaxID=196821 RepID=UPI0021CAAEC1|nr:MULTISPECIES: hypothetical protein [unclassified Pseudomonas]MCU1735623.1 hypothetical protein [Pseudomonas sp. 20P_3.2_Bac4]MCU1747190.1 hypothetical protein [Pseudomonas sp. 20P_3.2_Bac5]
MHNSLFPALPLAITLTLNAPLASAEATPTLTIWVFPHDELSELSDEQLQKDYFEAWMDEIRLIARLPVALRFTRRIPGLTDITYQGLDASATLSEWADAASVWRRQQPSPEDVTDNKYLLLTRNELERHGNDSIFGMAYQTGHSAIASLGTYATVGHELGHTLSATHEQSYVSFNGWFCETYMFPNRFGLRSNCYRYSDENRENIANYLKRLR